MNFNGIVGALLYKLIANRYEHFTLPTLFTWMLCHEEKTCTHTLFNARFFLTFRESRPFFEK